MLTLDSNAPNIAAVYRGQVATRCVIPPIKLSSGGGSWVMAQTRHWAHERIVNPTVIYANFYVEYPNEELFSGPGTIKCGLQTPDGNFAQAVQTVNGPIAFPNGLTALDFNVDIPAQSFFNLRPMIQNPSGVICNSMPNGNVAGTYDGFEYGTGTPPDKTMSGSISLQAGQSFTLFPIAIIANTRRPSVVIFGDSIGIGTYDSVSDAKGDTGFSRVLGQKFGVINLAVSGSLLQGYIAANRTWRDRLLQWTGSPIVSHGFTQLGTNDIGTGADGPTTAARRAALAALYPKLAMGGTTLFPYTSSSDNFTTRSGQTNLRSATAVFNDLVRAGIVGERYCIDAGDVCDVLRAGVWPVSRDFLAASGPQKLLTSDGLHPSPVMYEQLRDRLVGQLQRISR